MSATPRPPLVAVKLTPMGRVQNYLLGSDSAMPVPRPGDRVVVNGEGGPAVGTVTRAIPQLDAKRRPPDDSPQRVVRVATKEDIVARLQHQHREREAYRIALLRIRERGLGMKLARVEQVFDGSKLIFYFTADGRVDFRELVRELAQPNSGRASRCGRSAFATRPRCIGGYGTCGRPLCCTTFLQTFEPVSIKMAKLQDLTLEPVEAVGPLRPAEMLPALRVAKRQRRAARRLRQRRRLRQPIRVWIRRRLRIQRLRVRRVRLVRIEVKPRMAITVGDPAGIGPEVAARAAADPRVLDVCEPVLYRRSRGAFRAGALSAAAGRAAYDVIVRAVGDARTATVDAIATAR